MFIQEDFAWAGRLVSYIQRNQTYLTNPDKRDCAKRLSEGKERIDEAFATAVRYTQVPL